MEIDGGDRINFLVTLIIENEESLNLIFIKNLPIPENILIFILIILQNTRKVFIINLLDRIHSPAFLHKKSGEDSINLINNRYPIDFIFSTIKSRIKHLSFSGFEELVKIEFNYYR